MKPGPAQFGERSRLESWLAAHEPEMAAFLCDLIAVPTPNPPGKNYRACADLLERRIGEFDLDCLRLEVEQMGSSEGEVPVCLLAGYGRGPGTLYFHGHYDVVPPHSPEQFMPRQSDRRVIGRGACDMKGGLVAMLYAVRALQECGIGFAGRIGLTLVPDEETGGQRGSQWLERGGLLGQGGVGMLSPEPTSGVVWNANRGAFSLRVQVHGRSAHVGLQHQGENAFENMLKVVARLQEAKTAAELHQTASLTGPSARPNSILLIGGASGGGTNFNAVPDSCWFTIDRRTNPEENLAGESAKLIAILEGCRAEGIRLDWQVLQEGASSMASATGPVALALAGSVESVLGAPPRFEICPGLLESRFYSARGIPAYCYGGGELGVAHGPDEFIDLEKLGQTALIYALTAVELFRR